MADEITQEIWRADDPVNSPSHYTQGDIECIDAIRASMGTKEFAGFLKGQVLKYIWRYEKKDKPSQDLEKAGWYLSRLLAFVNEHQPYFGKHAARVDFVTGDWDETTPETARKLRDALDNVDMTAIP